MTSELPSGSNARNAFRVYATLEAVSAFAVALIYATSVLYWVREGNLNPLSLVLLGTVLEGAYFVMQVPSGVMADTVSRRLCVIVGCFLVAVGFLLQGASADLAVLLTAQVPIGFGAALMLGAQEAWLADESESSDQTSSFLRATQLAMFGTFAGSILSGFVADVALNLTFLIGGGLYLVLGVFLLLFMHENHFHPPERAPSTGGFVSSAWRTGIGQVKLSYAAIIAVPTLGLILLMTFFVGLWGESFDRLWSAYLLLDIGLPKDLHLSSAMWFSAITAVASLLSMGAAYLARRRTERLGTGSVVETLLIAILLAVVAVLTMALARSFGVAVVAYFLVATIGPIIAPLIAGWVIARVRPAIRATALSAVDLFDGGGQILGGPLVGLVGLFTSIRVALIAGVAALASAAALLCVATRHLRANPEWAAVDVDEAPEAAEFELTSDPAGGRL